MSYQKEVNIIKRWHQHNFAFTTGIWIPNGKLRQIGAVPEIGVLWGAKVRSLNYGMSFKYRIYGPISVEALRVSTNSYDSTNGFGLGFVGLDLGFDLWSKDIHEVQVLSGAGWDIFSPYHKTPKGGYDSEVIYANTLNLGLGYRYYRQNNSYVSLQWKYNFTDFTRTDIVKLTGNYHSVQLLIGWQDSRYKLKQLKRMAQPLER